MICRVSDKGIDPIQIEVNTLRAVVRQIDQQERFEECERQSEKRREQQEIAFTALRRREARRTDQSDNKSGWLQEPELSNV